MTKSRVCTYLTFGREAEAAFSFYKKVFQSDFNEPVVRVGDMPASEQPPAGSGADKNLIMHIELPILSGQHLLRGSDTPEGMGFELRRGNSISINLDLETRHETDQLFSGLAAGGIVHQPLIDAFWGDYFGYLTDRFGVQWMFTCSEKHN